MNTKKSGLVVCGGTQQVPLKEIKNKVTIKGLVASVESTLYYINNEDNPLEAEFVFPLDSGAAVYKFEAEIDGKVIIAECQEKEQAQETYDDAMSAGHSAMYLGEDETGDVFRLKLGNLPAKKNATLTLGYVCELEIEVGVVKFTLPTVLDPRYSPAPPCEDVDDAITQNMDNVSSSPKSEKKTEAAPMYTDPKNIPYKMTFQAVVCGGYKIDKVTSLRDALSVQLNDSRDRATLELSSAFKFDHDIELSVFYEDFSKPEFVLEKGIPEKAGLLKEDILMLNFVPKFVNAADMKCEFVFIIDRSGSMVDDRIQKAKETLLLLLKSLPVTCKFNIIGFGSSYSTLFPRSEVYNENSLEKALELQRKINSDMGGTEIYQPMKFVYDQELEPGYQRQIFLLTDGEVSNASQIINMAKKNLKTSRVFTFGIGDGCSTELIKGVARASKGKATFIRDNDRFQSKVLSVLQHSTQPAVTDLLLLWKLPFKCTAVNIPSETGPIYKDDKLILYALMQGYDGTKKGETSGSLKLTGNIGGEKLKHSLKFDLSVISENDASLPLHRLAAKSQIKELEDKDGDRELEKQKIVLVSTASNMISKYTAFVGVDKNSKVPIEETRMRPIPTSSCYYGSQSMNLMSYGFCSSAPGKSKGAFFKMPNFGFLRSKRTMKNTQGAGPPPPPPAAATAATSSGGGFMGGFISSSMSAPPPPPPQHTLLDQEVGRRRDTACRASAPPPPPPPQQALLDDFFCMGMDDAYQDDEDEEMDYLGKDTNVLGDGMMNLVKLQSFNGSWKLVPDFARILQKELQYLEQQCPVKDTSVWATILAITYLQKNHKDEKDVWLMIEKKAISWLETQDLEGKSVESLRQTAVQFV